MAHSNSHTLSIILQPIHVGLQMKGERKEGGMEERERERGKGERRKRRGEERERGEGQ